MILTVAQGPDGYLWLGTEFGLVRFDGVRAVPWKPPSGQQLPSEITDSLLFARYGTLRIGTTNGLASWKDGKLAVHPEAAGRHIPNIIQDREGTIWAIAHSASEGAKICSIRNARVECQGAEGILFGPWWDWRVFHQECCKTTHGRFRPSAAGKWLPVKTMPAPISLW